MKWLVILQNLQFMAQKDENVETTIEPKKRQRMIYKKLVIEEPKKEEVTEPSEEKAVVIEELNRTPEEVAEVTTDPR